MKERTKRESIIDGINRYINTYLQNDYDRSDKIEKLRLLNKEKVSKNIVDEIIGNSTWTSNNCYECGKHRKNLIIFERDNEEFCICKKCLKAALYCLE